MDGVTRERPQASTSRIPPGRVAPHASPGGPQAGGNLGEPAVPVTSIVEDKGLVGRARRVLTPGAAAALTSGTANSVNQSAVTVQEVVGKQAEELEILGEACAEECYHWWLPTLPCMRAAQRTEIQDSLIDEHFQLTNGSFQVHTSCSRVALQRVL